MRDARRMATREVDRGRRMLLQGAVGLAGGGVLAAVLPYDVGLGALAAQAPAAPGTYLLLLGTQGGPTLTTPRGQTASAVIAGGVPYLVDCGYGTLRALTQAGVRLNDVVNVFTTHLHDDHTADIAAMLSFKWTGAQPRATIIHGPYGTGAMVDGAIAFIKGNTDIRMIDEGRTARPETFFRGRDVTAPKATEVFRDERVTVRAVENTHFPERATAKMLHRALAYRFDTPGRSIVFSGDTAYSASLVELARDADVFVCEAIDTALHAQLLKAAQSAPGGLSGESVARHVVETHSTTEDAGRMAAEARVKTLVLNHLLPGSNPQRGGGIPDAQYIQGVRKYFGGEVIVGADQMKI